MSRTTKESPDHRVLRSHSKKAGAIGKQKSTLVLKKIQKAAASKEMPKYLLRSYAARKIVSRTSSNTPSSPLHRDGFQIIRSAVKVPPNLLENIQKQSQGAAAIFNQSKGANDRKRRQCNLKRNSALVRDFYAQAQEAIGEHINTSFLSATDPVILHSKPGCKAQAAHCDYIPDANLMSATDDQMPLGVIIALMPGTKLRTWPGSAKLITAPREALTGLSPIFCKEASLKAGDILVFRGDFVHAGSAYDKDNFRIHFFADSPLVPREKNRTWLCDHHASDEFQRVVRTDVEPTPAGLSHRQRRKHG